MSKLGTTIISLILLAGLFCSAIGANIAPSLVNYQARLTNPGGTPLNGNYTLVFTLYDAPTGGSIIWQETHSSVAVSDGFLSVLLGSGTIPVPLSDVAFGTDSRYLGVKIGADPEISPRSRMVATPYSQRVNTVDQARGGIISGQLEVHDDAAKDGDLVSAKIKVVGASLRSVSIQPSLNVALLATATDGDEVVRLDALDTGGALRISGATNNQVASVSATGSGGNITVNSVGGDAAAQMSADAGGGQLELFDISKSGRSSVRRFWARPERLSYYDATGLIELMSVNTAGSMIARGLNASTTNSLKNLRLSCTGGDNITEVAEAVPQGNGAYGQGNNLSAADNSFAVGLCNILSGDRNVTFGTENVVLGTSGNCFVVGAGDTIEAPSFQSVAFGIENSIRASQAFVAGSFNRTTSSSSVCFGQANYDSSGLNNSLFGSNDTIWASTNSSILAGNQSKILNSSGTAIVCGYTNQINGVQTSVIGGGERNRISKVDNGNTTFAAALIAGGSDNISSSDWAAVVGGESNRASGGHSFVGGGSDNTASGNLSAVGAGTADTASGTWSFVGAGLHNVASGQGSVVSGGQSNRATGITSVVSAGIGNIASGLSSTVVGGESNIASAFHSTVVGGAFNEAAGDNSLAAGFRAKIASAHDGTFLWADQTDADFNSSAANQFRVRATGGVQLVAGIGPETGVELIPGSGSWSTLSDRNVKDNVEEVDVDELLERLAAMPIGTWNYKTQDASVRHIGPMAQDFFAAFGVGDKETLISSVDADGVALAAIQALYKRTQQLQDQAEEIEALKAQLAEVQSLLAKLAAVKK